MFKFLLCFFLPIQIFASTSVAIIGDSISIGLNSTPGNSFIEVLQDRYALEEKDIVLLNRSYGGATTDTLFNIGISVVTMEHPEYIIIFLGINDATGMVPEDQLLANFSSMMQRCHGNCKKIILGGVYCQLNPAYNTVLVNVYTHLINAYNPYPVLLLSQDALVGSIDGVHPTDAGHAIIANYIYDALLAVGAY